MKYFELLKEKILTINDIPFKMLKPDDQEIFLRDLKIFFLHLNQDLNENNAKESFIGNKVLKIINLLNSGNFEEYEFIIPLIEILKTTPKEYEEKLKETIDILESLRIRTEALHISENFAKEMRETKTKEEITSHDKKIIENDMQIYALDYFLHIYKQLITNNAEANVMIFEGNEDLPSLILDALTEDMLTKIVYRLWDQDLRSEMIEKYYQYKTFFLTINKNKFSDEDFNELKNILKNYCLSLLEISKKNGIHSILNGFYLPYKKGTLIESIINELTKN